MNSQNLTNKTSHSTSGVKKEDSPTQKSHRKRIWVWVIGYLVIVGFMIVSAGLAGYQSGEYTHNAIATKVVELSLEEQYQLAIQDMEAQRYAVALQRFEYIIAQDPSYPGITDQMAVAMQILYATATPTPPKATITPTPTRDLRPVEDLYGHALSLAANQSWTETIDTLIALRNEDPDYRTTRVDGLLYLSLHMRGVQKIWQLGNLEGGLYDLALAERFGPLDVQANSARDLARLYIIGSSFWEVHPEQAVYYFGQVASAAPGLHDASGWTALERYRAALIQYGDLLTSQSAWCEAQRQYELAMAVRADDQLVETLKAVMLKCSPPTNTPEPEEPSHTPTQTPLLTTLTLPPQFTATPSQTGIIPPTASNTTTSPTETEAPPTNTETQVIAPSPTDSQVAPPTATFTTETPPQETEPPVEG